MMNFNGYIESGNQYSAGLYGSSLTSLYFVNRPEFEKRLDGLDEEARKEVMKHMDEFQTVEQLEMFIKQRTKNGDQIT